MFPRVGQSAGEAGRPCASSSLGRRVMSPAAGKPGRVPVLQVLHEDLGVGTARRSLRPESPRTRGFASGLPASPVVGPSGSRKLLGYCSLNRGPNTHVPGDRQWIGPKDAPSYLRLPDLSSRRHWYSPAHMTSGRPPPRSHVPLVSAEGRGLPGRLWQRQGRPSSHEVAPAIVAVPWAPPGDSCHPALRSC